MLALFALACSTVEEDAGSTSTRSEDTGPETTEPWCCWCDEQGEIRCLDATGPGECKALGAALGVDVVETGCTGLPALGTLDCPGLVCELPSDTTDGGSADCDSTDGGGGLAACCEIEGVCDGGSTETGEPPPDIPFADPSFACCSCDLPPTCKPWGEDSASCEANGLKWCELDNGVASACFEQC